MKRARLMAVGGAVVALVGVGVVSPAPSSANHKTCHQATPFLGQFAYPDRDESGTLSGAIHDNAERAEGNLDPQYRAIHYVNCTFVAPN